MSPEKKNLCLGSLVERRGASTLRGRHAPNGGAQWKLKPEPKRGVWDFLRGSGGKGTQYLWENSRGRKV